MASYFRRILAAMLAASLAGAAAAGPFPVYLPTHIYWISSFPYVPSTVSGTSVVYADAAFDLGVSTITNVDPNAGPTEIPSPPNGSFMVLPGQTLYWTFAGAIAFGGATLPICAFAGLSAPSGPCNENAPPMIPIVTLANADFPPFLVSGSIFTADGATRLGTWQIWSNSALIDEPAVTALFVTGFAALAFFRGGRRATISGAAGA